MESLTLYLQEKDLAFSTFIGVVVSVCGNALISVALNVQKLAHNRLQERQMVNYFANMDEPPRWISASTGNLFYPDDGYSSPRTSSDGMDRDGEDDALAQFMMVMQQEQRQNDNNEYLHSKLWWIGITLMIVGEVGNFVAYGFAPASTIAPLGTTTLVANVILAPLMLKEHFRKRDLVGIILAVAGAATVVLSSNEQEIALSPELILEAMTQMRAIIYFIVTGVAIMGLTAISPWYGAESILVDLGLVAIYGGYTVLCTKSVASLLSLTLFKMFTYPISYVMILVLVITAVLQIKYLNKALQRFDSTAVIPTQFVLFTVSAIIGSAVIYHDFDDMGLNQMSRFMSGCAIEFLGVYLITSKRHKKIGAIALESDKNERVPHNDTAIYITTPPRSSHEEEQDELEPLVQPPQQGPRLLPDPHGPNGPRRVSTASSIASSGRRGLNAHVQGGGHGGHGGIELGGGPFAPSLRPHASSQTARSQQPSHYAEPEWLHPPSVHASMLPDGFQGRRRRSSLIRGISIASQLVDRSNDDEDDVNHALPPRHHDPRLSQLFAGLSSLAHDVFAPAAQPPAQPTTPNTPSNTTSANDAIEIDIPTAAQAEQQHENLQEPTPAASASNSSASSSIEPHVTT
ncbi:magnesium transporter NIPA-domain-containing protein [Gongronella butleri]|nr:magnesium transporter NIPA-domain-containing protein [Gongronella butleri]